MKGKSKLLKCLVVTSQLLPPLLASQLAHGAEEIVVWGQRLETNGYMQQEDIDAMRLAIQRASEAAAEAGRQAAKAATTTSSPSSNGQVKKATQNDENLDKKNDDLKCTDDVDGCAYAHGFKQNSDIDVSDIILQINLRELDQLAQLDALDRDYHSDVPYEDKKNARKVACEDQMSVTEISSLRCEKDAEDLYGINLSRCPAIQIDANGKVVSIQYNAGLQCRQAASSRKRSDLLGCEISRKERELVIRSHCR